jgi:hypothetical protein
MHLHPRLALLAAALSLATLIAPGSALARHKDGPDAAAASGSHRSRPPSP